MRDRASIGRRKTEHIEVCLHRPVEFQHKRSWLEHVQLVHQAVPTFSMSDVRLSFEFLGRKLAAPFIIGAMTGGTPESAIINRDLARLAAEKGVGLALGSQRPMLEDPSTTPGYCLRDVASDVLILGNIGLPQAAALKTEEVIGLMTQIGADGICLHLNATMEMFQEGGDEPTRNADAVIGRLAGALGDRLIVKETGCGMSRETASRLVRLGVRNVDVAGAGGTSWVRVEKLRRGTEALGLEKFEEWGIPTAASLLEVRGLNLRPIASGGLRSGLDAAKAVALGAHAASAALPILRALDKGGVEEAGRWLDGLITGLKRAMVLTGCPDLKTLREAPAVISGPLLEWAVQRGLRRQMGESDK